MRISGEQTLSYVTLLTYLIYNLITYMLTTHISPHLLALVMV